MSSTLSVAPGSTTRRFTSLITVIAATIVFFLVVGVTSESLRARLAGHVADTLRTRVTVAISGSALGELIVLVLLVVFLRKRGRSLRDLGLWQRASWRGWAVSAIFTALYLGLTLAGELRGQWAWGEASVFHIYNSLAAGISAGFIEEIFFRGFVMNELKWSGFGTPVQVIASGVLFGVAHVGWGLIAANVNWAAAIGSVVATGILGVLYAITYVVSRRSLMPAIGGHMLADFLIEPWLVLMAFAGMLGSHR